MKMTPAASRADLSFWRASSETRIPPSASTRLTVGTDNPERSASSPWDQPNNPRAARICATEIMLHVLAESIGSLIPKVSSNGRRGNAPAVAQSAMQGVFLYTERRTRILFVVVGRAVARPRGGRSFVYRPEGQRPAEALHHRATTRPGRFRPRGRRHSPCDALFRTAVIPSSPPRRSREALTVAGLIERFITRYADDEAALLARLRGAPQAGRRAGARAPAGHGEVGRTEVADLLDKVANGRLLARGDGFRHFEARPSQPMGAAPAGQHSSCVTLL